MFACQVYEITHSMTPENQVSEFIKKVTLVYYD